VSAAGRASQGSDGLQVVLFRAVAGVALAPLDGRPGLRHDLADSAGVMASDRD
jgi:hypothetical protein